MKRSNLIIISILLAIPMTMSGQGKHWERRNNQTVNIGMKAGFNSSMYLVSEFKIKDVTIDNTQNNYRIGYFGALFMRFNFQRHYLQPEVSLQLSRCEIIYDKLGSQLPEIEPDYAQVKSKIYSVELPVLYGYNIIKRGPYGLSVFAGPKLKYFWNKRNEITFENFDLQNIHEELYPFNISVTLGVGVNISRIFFDFRYEQGLNNISKSITFDNAETINNEQDTNKILFKRRDNVLSFSLGFMF